jgi:hypothetical protein
VTVEFIGDAKSLLDPQLVHHAAHAVLHYFKVEQGKNQVSVGEFAQALATVLRGLGIEVGRVMPPAAPRIARPSDPAPGRRGRPAPARLRLGQGLRTALLSTGCAPNCVAS